MPSSSASTGAVTTERAVARRTWKGEYNNILNTWYFLLSLDFSKCLRLCNGAPDAEPLGPDGLHALKDCPKNAYKCLDIKLY